MRRWGLAVVVVLAVVVGAAPTARADDQVPVSYGTASGWMDGDLGSCWGQYDLDGHFAFRDGPPVDTVARLQFSGGCPVAPPNPWTTNGTITAPQFSGACYVADAEISVAVNPFGGVPFGHQIDIQCSLTMTNGDYHELYLDIYVPSNAGLSHDTTGVFVPAYWALI